MIPITLVTYPLSSLELPDSLEGQEAGVAFLCGQRPSQLLDAETNLTW